MTTTREFTCGDLFHFGNINIDRLTETYNLSFYFQYIVNWPDLNYALDSPNGQMQGYIIGKVEGKEEQWHSHVTALTIAAGYRRIGLAKKLMDLLELVSDVTYRAYFVDLFVRCRNDIAIKAYNVLGYIVYQKVLKYYTGEDALTMRKALSRDVEKKSMIPCPNPAKPEDVFL